MSKPASLENWSCVLALFGTFGLLPSVSALAATGENAQQPIEEIVVTGSLIRRDSFDSPSPLTVVGQEQIANNASPNLGEVLVNQTFNYGTDFQTNTYAARPQVGSTSSANLRGLGERATLNLLDGKRGASTNLNNALPQIAIERIDILKDGASATYGSDAVAGVVNIIPRKNYSGAEVSVFHQQDSENDFSDNQYEFIMGSDTDNGHIMIAGSYGRRSTLAQVERPKFLRKGFERSSTGNPGTWLVPDPRCGGCYRRVAVMPDPGCGVSPEASPGGTDVGKKGNYLTGQVVGSLCNFHFGETWNYINPQEKMSFYTDFEYDFSDTIHNDISFLASRLTTDSRGSPQNPGGRTEEFPIVLGDHPGNPYRAMTSDGVPLYAVDANGDGIPDRGTVDANGDGVPDVIVAGTDPAGGVPFNEDVDVVALRIFGKIGLLPGANQPTALNADGSNTGNATFDAFDYTASDTLTISIPNTSWQIAGTAIMSRQHVVLDEKNTSQNALVAGLQGNLISLPSSDPRAGDPNLNYWNPFSTQALHCENRVCAYTGTPDDPNPVPVLDAVNIQSNQVTDNEFYSYDALATGDLFELPAGMVQGAFGSEYRKNTTDVDASAARNQCDWHEGGCAFDYKADQDVWSAYFELSVPAVQGLNLTLAGRYSDYSGDVGDSFDPKIAMLWQPIDILSIRASWGTAFIAPDLVQLYSPEACGLQTMTDDLTGDQSGTFRVACVSGNQGLKAEQADTYNIGFSIDLLDGDLTFGADYADYDFQDRISQETGNNVIRASFARFLDANGLTAQDWAAVPDKSTNNPLVAEWIDPANNHEPKIFRDTTGVVTRVITDRLNAQSMETASWDFYTRYNLPFERFGNFTVGVNATYIDKYTYDLGTGDPLDRGDGAGKQNEQVAEVPPLPKWRVNGTVDWNMGNHSAWLRVRWIDGFDLEFNSAALQGAQVFFNGTSTAKTIYYTDLNYKYTFDRLFGDRATTIEVGANNVFDEYPEPIFNLGGIETFVHDVRGRMWYARIRQDL